MLEQVVAIIERDLPDNAFLTSQWPALRAAIRAQWAGADSVVEQEALLNGLLAKLEVSHCLLQTPTVRSTIADKTADPRRLAPVIRRVGDTLLASVRSFKVGTTTLDDLRTLAAEATEARRVVLDLRLNDGGSGGLVAELCGLFLPPGTPVLRVRRRGTPEGLAPHVVTTFREDTTAGHESEVRALLDHTFVEYRVPEDAVGEFGGPVVVIVDARCYSCGEVFVQAMKEHGRAPVVGKTSAGMVIAARMHELEGGCALLFPFAEMRSGKGALLEGRGVTPGVELEVGDLDDEALLAALGDHGFLSSP